MNQKARGAHSIYLCQYHLVWCPKFWFCILKELVAEDLKDIFYEIAREYDFTLLEMEVMPDHVHLFIGAKPNVAPSNIVKILKSISAIRLFRKNEKLRKFYSLCGALWSKGKFISTIGFVSAETIKKYIREPKAAI